LARKTTIKLEIIDTPRSEQASVVVFMVLHSGVATTSTSADVTIDPEVHSARVHIVSKSLHA